MNLHYATKPSSVRGGTILGIFIGLVLGLGIAIGVAVYLNQSVPKALAPAQAADSGSESAAPADSILVDTSKPRPADAAKEPSRFAFYDILPGTDKPAPAEAPAKPVEAAPAAERSGEKLYLQVGAFQNAGDADNLRAKLALLGVEANVLQAHLPDRGDVHRVRVGPFSSLDEVTPVRGNLAKSGIQASLVRVPANEN
jgi:cell division protein FtsN